jgi:hypothetical protein
MPSKRRRVRGNPSDEFEWVSIDGNMSPRTVAALGDLLNERLPDGYPVEAHDGSEDARVLLRRKVEPVGVGRYGKLRWVIPARRLKTLLPSLLRSSREDEMSLGSGILYTLHIEVV